MTNLEKAARALLAHWDTPAWKYLKPTGDLMADLREALAEQAEQEPVAWMFVNDDGECEEIGYGKDYLKGYEMMADFQPLYAAPVRKKDLTPHEITALIREGAADGGWQGFAQRVIAADREKNKCQH